MPIFLPNLLLLDFESFSSFTAVTRRPSHTLEYYILYASEATSVLAALTE